MDARAGRARRVGGARQRRRDVARGSRRTGEAHVRRDAAALDLPLRLRRRAASRSRPPNATAGPFRMFHRETDAAKVARNREAIFDLHASALEWLEQYTGIPYPLGKFDFLLVPSFQFGGMEHAGRDLLQRLRPAARPVGDPEPAARARQRHRPRDLPHVVRRSRHDALVQRRVDEGGVRQFHGREDRQPVVPGDQSRAALPATRTTRAPTTSTAPPERTPSASRSRTSTRRARCTARSSTRRRRSSCGSSNGFSARRRSATGCASTCTTTRSATRPGRIS